MRVEPTSGRRRARQLAAEGAGPSAPAPDAAPTLPGRMPAAPSPTLAARLRRIDPAWYALGAIALVALALRLYGLNWDANNHLHPDEREIVFVSMCLSFPGQLGLRPGNCPAATGGPGWFLSPASPLNPHFFAYGSFPLYLLAIVAHGLAWLTHLTGGRFVPSDGGAWDDFNHFTLIGRTLSALFDTGSVVVIGLLGRRLIGPRAALLAAAFVAVIPFEIQVAHFYAVDTVLTFFVLLTLLGCVLLAQGPRPDAERPFAATWGTWALGLLTGLGFGLAIGSKVSALPLLVPILVALVLRWRRRTLDEALLGLLGILSTGVLTFILTNPYVLIDWHEFISQVSTQTALSRGQLDYPYVRQFAGTTPYLYELRQLVLYDMWVPLGLLGLAGAVWVGWRVWRRLDDDWLPILVWLLVYFAIIGEAYMKFTRYMLPIFPLLALAGAGMLAALARAGTRWACSLAAAPAGSDGASAPGDAPLAHPPEPASQSGITSAIQLRGGAPRAGAPRARLTPPALAAARAQADLLARRLTARLGTGWVRRVALVLAVLTLGATAFAGLALDNLYSAPNTRVQASEWIYDHVPPGAAITDEVWDDSLPILVPAAQPGRGFGLTAAGHVIDPGEYTPISLNLYDEDTPQKADQLSQQLATADAVVISSQRLVRSIPKLPDRYPMTTRYYQLLFAGKLGFKLAAQFQTAPHLFGLTMSDNGADESFSVYDHPPVWIFTRSGPAPSASQLLATLTDGLHLPAASTRSGSQKPLLLSPAAAKADAASAPLGVQFPATSLPNRIPLIWWLFVVELVGLFAFPLTYLALPGLRDRGWGVSKLVGLLLIAYVVWLPASLSLLPFTGLTVAVAFALLALAGGVVALRRRADLLAFVRARWRLLVVCEVGFLAVFALFTFIRALDPDLWHIWRGGEKPMELAFLNGILRSQYMPPADPWFSGGYINYYYYGQYLIAVLIRLTGIAPTTAFNLAVPLICALGFAAAFSVAAGLTGRAWAGVAGGVGLMIVANLDGAWQVLGQWSAAISRLPIPVFDYWRSSRVIPYTINEFPFWSALYADLHAHLIDLPVVVLLMALCGSLLAQRGAPWRATLPTLALAALTLGAAACVNTWDLPTFALLLGAVIVLRELGMGWTGGWRAVRARLTWPVLRRTGASVVLLIGAAYALYLPFYTHFQSFVQGTGPVAHPTDPFQFFTVFGIWLFLVASFFMLQLRDRWEQRIARLARLGRPAAVEGRGRRLWLVVGVSLLVLAIAGLISVKALLVVLLVAGLTLALDPRHPPARLLAYAFILLGLAIALGVEIIYVRDFLDNSDWERMNTVFKFYYQVWELLALGCALAFAELAPRMVAADAQAEAYAPATGWADADDADDVDDAMLVYVSTVAPSQQAAHGAGSADGLDALDALDAGDRAPDDSLAPVEALQARPAAAPWSLGLDGRVLLRGVWLACFVALLAGSLVFDVEGTAVRVQDPLAWAQVQPPPGGIQPQGLSLDGMAYMRGWYPGDYAAITWMNEHIAGIPTIIEASTNPYEWYGRVSIYTGLPAVLGWSSHESQQRYGDQVYARQNDVELFYTTVDPQQALSILEQYGVQYVYVGDLERTCPVQQGQACVTPPPAALQKYQTLVQQGALRPVYQNSSVTIYQVVR